MARLKASELDSRRRLDFAVLKTMDERCDCISVEAYATASDLRARQNRITRTEDSHRARHYLIIYAIKTLIGPGKFIDQTRIHVDTEVANYPFQEPASWVLSTTPWSPHFLTGAPVCTGDHWERSGRSLLGHLVRHHAKILNWDEKARGGGYRGWNGEAIAWHRKHYGSKPLSDGLRYPEIPVDIAYGLGATGAEAELFGATSRTGTPRLGKAAASPLFEGATRHR